MAHNRYSSYSSSTSWHTLGLVKAYLRQQGCRQFDETSGSELWFSPITRDNFKVASKVISREGANAILASAGVMAHF